MNIQVLLDLGMNKLSGTIPVQLSLLTGLRKLPLYTVAFVSWAFLTHCFCLGRNLLLQGNSLTGTVPTELGRLRRLSEFKRSERTHRGAFLLNLTDCSQDKHLI